MTFREMLRRADAQYCATARCPNKLGNSPWRFCSEHFRQPIDSSGPKVSDEAKEAMRYYPVGFSLDPVIFERIKQSDTPVGVRNLAEKLGMPRSSLMGIMDRLVKKKMIRSTKPGYYVAK